MEIGERVAVTMAGEAASQCIICGNDHPSPKKEEIAKTAGKTGWKRVSMSSKFERVGPKLAIYPGAAFPPTSYHHEGHHCVALSSFVANEKTDPTDMFPTLNYFLNKGGYSPNRHENCIGLPGRLGYTAFWAALDANKPLQMHIGDHDDSFMAQSTALLIRLLNLLTDPDDCKERSQQDFEKKLQEGIKHAENYAFRKLASNDEPWRLHPVDEQIALDVYFMPTDETKQYRRKSGERVTYRGMGRQGSTSSVAWPDPALEIGMFKEKE
jgi:hypothetical protein